MKTANVQEQDSVDQKSNTAGRNCREQVQLESELQGSGFGFFQRFAAKVTTRANALFDRAEQSKDLRTTLCLLLIAVTVAVYAQVATHQFINYDDQLFAYNNPHVYTGITTENLKWDLGTLNGGVSYYHPLTWLTHQLDCQLFNLRPGAHHLTNLWFHIANTLLLFMVLNQITGTLWRSGVVAALFALHPLHTETVAWIAERKSLVCTFFWLLTTWAYVRYAQRANTLRYLTVVIFYAASLMSKPLAVTLPLTLMLLDFWPLRRFWLSRRLPCQTEGNRLSAATLRRLLLEKVPLFVLAFAASWVTVLAQKDLGAVAPLAADPLASRFNNALVAYLLYVRKTLWPSHLAVLYPLRTDWPWWQVAGSAVFLLGVSIWAVREAVRFPYWFVGWFWFLGTLFPMIGFVQVGSQGMADRYTYIPLIGLFIALIWTAAEVAARIPRAKPKIVVAILSVLGACATSTVVQLCHWKTSVRLFKHATQVTRDNYFAHNLLALAFRTEGNSVEARNHISESMRLQPGMAANHSWLGQMSFEEGDNEAAYHQYSLALALKPDDPDAHAGFASFLENCERPRFHNQAKALFHARRACELTHYRDEHFLAFLVGACVKSGRYTEATQAARKARKLAVGPQQIKSAERLVEMVREREASKQ